MLKQRDDFFRNWGGLLDRPVFVLTSDQDWAPEWAVQTLWDTLQELGSPPLHVFRTNSSPLLDALAADGRITQGWHPNFMPGSTHGASAAEVVAWCQTRFPGLRTVRTHYHAEDTERMAALAGAGIVADSQGVASYQPWLSPLLHWSGIVRLPVFLEDDIFFGESPNTLDLAPLYDTLFSPGLKIVDFHPTFVACNTPSRAFHEEHRRQVFGGGPPVRWGGRGTAHVLAEVLEQVDRWTSFETLVDTVLNSLPWRPPAFRRNPDPTLPNPANL